MCPGGKATARQKEMLHGTAEADGKNNKKQKTSALLKEIRGKQYHVEEGTLFLSQGTARDPLSQPESAAVPGGERLHHHGPR